MKSAICWFSGAGNSKAVAHDLQQRLGYDHLLAIPEVIKNPALLTNITTLGLVFPIYFFGPPAIVRILISETLKELELKLDYLFVILTHGGLPFYAPTITDRLLADAGYAASYVDTIAMIDTYIPLFKIPKEEKQQAIHSKIGKKIETITSSLLAQDLRVAMRLPFARQFHNIWQNSLVKRSHKDKNFIITDQCTSCGICAQVCPVQNIVMEHGQPTFLHTCEQCFACYHHCPEHAIALQRTPVRGYTWYTPPNTFISQE